tara:strand:+ start:337 stop:759 length:423 start_codon:yes stop_codon:yes gene_type:complete
MFNANVSICYLKNKDGKKIPIRNPFDWVKAQHSTKSWNATRWYSNDVENYIERLWTKGAEELQKENKNFVITLSKGKKTWNGWDTYSYIKKPVAKFKKVVCYIPLIKKKLKGSNKKYHPTSYLNKFILDQDKNLISKEVV